MAHRLARAGFARLLLVVEAGVSSAASVLGGGQFRLRQADHRRRPVAFAIPRRPDGGIIFNLCLLGYFKYAGFFVANVDNVFGAQWVVPSIILPIGISFITFQKIAFLVDAHRGLVRNFTLLNYAFFVTFFPQLIAGPITHHSEIMPQIGPAQRRDLTADLAVGISIFVVGLFKKVVIADSLAIYADAGYSMLRAGHPLDSASAWVTVLCYSFQLYYDFSGYSDMAVGLARMFGFRLPVNFYSPYKSTSIIDFWRRWHITLSRFLRDYLYIPLGGNRHGPVRRYLNLGIVMLLGGFWHGANWTFVVWGGATRLDARREPRLARACHQPLSRPEERAGPSAIAVRDDVRRRDARVGPLPLRHPGGRRNNARVISGRRLTDPQGLSSFWGLLQGPVPGFQIRVAVD